MRVEDLRAMIPNRDFGRELAESRGFNAEFGWNGGEEDVLMPKDVSFPTLIVALVYCDVSAMLHAKIHFSLA
jgi:hypothetical protein